MNILFIAAEVEGFAKTGGLADVAKALPLALKRQGHDVRIVMPYYQSIAHRERAAHLGDFGLITREGGPQIGYAVRQLMLEEVPVYLIDCPRYFDRKSLYAENNNAYGDNGERFAFFSATSLQVAQDLNFRPDIVHCNDWHTALVPMLLKTRHAGNPFFQQSRCVITIHNGAYQGVYEHHQVWALPEITHPYNDALMQGHGYVNYLKCGVMYADKINAVSPGYAGELTTYLGGHGMTRSFQERAGDLSGIVNGCDYNDWDPETDPLLPYNYTATNLTGKAMCKRALQEKVGLAQEDVPVFGMVCRLTEQKGLHFLLPILDQFLRHKVQVIIEGSGDPLLASRIEQLAAQYPERLAFFNGYDNALAHLIEAGSDFFLMPSLFEPCGLNQMYSLVYGTLPIIREVGGLKDTVTDYDADPARATGFSFLDPEPVALLNTLRRALLLYVQEPEEFARVQQNAMHSRFDWSESVKAYEHMYEAALTPR